MQDQPALFSTFLMWLLADLFNDLPEVGDLDKPKLVFFFDEAHLLFRDASKDFLAAITQTVRLIRSKGVGIFFVTQTPKDVPGDVLAQLGSRVQHQLRAFTPDDAKALRATVSTFPHSGYDLDEVLTGLGIGEAVVTVMNEKGAPSPVAWTRLRAPVGVDGAHPGRSRSRPASRPPRCSPATASRSTGIPPGRCWPPGWRPPPGSPKPSSARSTAPRPTPSWPNSRRPWMRQQAKARKKADADYERLRRQAETSTAHPHQAAEVGARGGTGLPRHQNHPHRHRHRHLRHSPPAPLTRGPRHPRRRCPDAHSCTRAPLPHGRPRAPCARSERRPHGARRTYALVP